MIAKYQADFPPENVTPPSLAHKTVHENLEVIQTAVISDRNAYDMELQRHIKASEEHEQKTIREYIQNRVAFLVSELDDDLPSKLKKLSLIPERKRKLVLYNQESDGPLNWQAIKTRRLNCFAGCGAGPSKTRALAIAFSCRPFPFGDRPYQFLPLGLIGDRNPHV